MPTLYTFGSYKIRIYSREHGIPHVHLIGLDCAAVIAIEDGDLIEGDAPAKDLETARAWIAANREIILALWRK